jgi:mannose-6-phosphate isomerase-like protein (cupin superfamily)
MKTRRYNKVIVKKPWGYEYLMFENGKVGVWHLFIRSGGETSLHCHPRKKTGYILLSGTAVVSFLNDSVSLTALSKLMIREGLFHSTKAASPEGVHVIEVESPPDKENLVRLDDRYGRKQKPYEGTKAHDSMAEECLVLQEPQIGTSHVYVIQGSEIVLERFEDISPIWSRPSKEIILVLDGGLMSKDGEFVLGPGDVVNIGTFNRLSGTFPASSGVSLMTVRTAPKESRN